MSVCGRNLRYGADHEHQPDLELFHPFNHYGSLQSNRISGHRLYRQSCFHAQLYHAAVPSVHRLLYCILQILLLKTAADLFHKAEAETPYILFHCHICPVLHCSEPHLPAEPPDSRKRPYVLHLHCRRPHLFPYRSAGLSAGYRPGRDSGFQGPPCTAPCIPTCSFTASSACFCPRCAATLLGVTCKMVRKARDEQVCPERADKDPLTQLSTATAIPSGWRS